MMYMDIKLAAGVLTLSVSLYRCEKCLQFLHSFPSRSLPPILVYILVCLEDVFPSFPRIKNVER